MPKQRVLPLSSLRRLKVAEGDPDVRGWEVVGEGGETIGTVEDLLVDTWERRVRTLVVRRGDGDFARRIHVPVEVAEPDAEAKQVRVPVMHEEEENEPEERRRIPDDRTRQARRRSHYAGAARGADLQARLVRPAEETARLMLMEEQRGLAARRTRSGDADRRRRRDGGADARGEPRTD